MLAEGSLRSRSRMQDAGCRVASLPIQDAGCRMQGRFAPDPGCRMLVAG
ncbi:MAG: hypothetical protein M0Q38_03330 [Bacteroidales bacterium]|nr:hypothetical protein [Bacteroidales bacterium]